MDRLDKYRVLIKKLLTDYAELINNRRRPPNSDDETFTVFDDEGDHYMIMTWGWWNYKRFRDADVYIRIKNDKLWIESDALEDGIATDLMEGGVLQEDIVLAFYHPKHRELTDFPVY